MVIDQSEYYHDKLLKPFTNKKYIFLSFEKLSELKVFHRMAIFVTFQLLLEKMVQRIIQQHKH